MCFACWACISVIKTASLFSLDQNHISIVSILWVTTSLCLYQELLKGACQRASRAEEVANKHRRKMFNDLIMHCKIPVISLRFDMNDINELHFSLLKACIMNYIKFISSEIAYRGRGWLLLNVLNKGSLHDVTAAIIGNKGKCCLDAVFTFCQVSAITKDTCGPWPSKTRSKTRVTIIIPWAPGPGPLVCWGIASGGVCVVDRVAGGGGSVGARGSRA